MTANKPGATDSAPSPTTQWLAIANVVFAGIAVALHVGKATIALPELQREFGRSLESLSWIISAFPFIGVFGGIAAGQLVRRWGDRRLLSLGLVIVSLASFAGATQHDFTGLIATRVIEGIGFVIVVVAAPTVLTRLVAPQQRNLVFSIWSTFMPAGMAISLFFGPHFAGWQQSWIAGGILTLLAALLLPFTTPRGVLTTATATTLRLRQALLSIIRARQPLLLALIFTTYNLQFFAVMAFLPIFLMQRIGLTLVAAGGVSAAVIAVNILGNLFAGVLLSRGVKARNLLTIASLLMGLAGASVFLSATPNAMLIPLCLLFSSIGGMLPATILAATPAAAPEPTLIPLSLGLVMQGIYLGQVIGPIVPSTLVVYAGWSAPSVLVLAAAVLGSALALALVAKPRI
ncbi:Methyl viologen resistance protein SmvA [Serratia quinivorans]|uniref:MFS transporter n=1 Tax=Serratia quinivorans TaxID=137545 RepID=UPI00217C3973|nr:MFS transporter [Serratia quinivorans]CAI0705963.1 Methyl viologen resistance protein SmvA [Serratia quinivorans]CAI1639678.1 Methyl viologen resistance protein SmvA [Serratia quinivorans]CAI1727624.1 Methyl viologen resistance protein SmvA [Serratia quinivorans]CAI2056765.1 Methyl viologen resistance protein SmvA [Serratia quinivorans]CAI2395485.1 Methyl viologen resistance protein SmvA [Serratia quinivorans]